MAISMLIQPTPETHHPMPVNPHPKRGFWQHHSLSIVSILVLVCWIVLYTRFDPSTHWGAFFGNAIADWTGVVVTVLATKFLYEKGSAESHKPPHPVIASIWSRLEEHSLSIFLLLTGVCWIAAFAHMNANSKWGQVVGNVVSEWTQIFGLVILTKRLIERHSKESR